VKQVTPRRRPAPWHEACIPSGRAATHFVSKASFHYFFEDTDMTAIALPAYQDYTVRARVSEGLVASDAAKINVTDVLASGNPNSSAQGYNLGFNPPTASRNVTSVAIAPATGIITVTMSANAGNGTLTLAPYTGAALPGTALPVGTAAFQPPADSVKWRCAAAGATPIAVGQTAGTLPARFAPSECK